MSELKKKWLDTTYKLIWMKRNYRKYKEKCINDLTQLRKKFRTGQKQFAIDFMLINPTKFVQQGEVLLYCDNQRNILTKGEKPNFKDNSRGIESLRRDTMPLCWAYKKINNDLYFKYVPELKELQSDKIIQDASNRKLNFSHEIIKLCMESCDYKCELTGLPIECGDLAADHWYPKESGGESVQKNCVILNKVLNEKKNNKEPTEWFMKKILNNFLNLCDRSEMNIDLAKQRLIHFIQEF